MPSNNNVKKPENAYSASGFSFSQLTLLSLQVRKTTNERINN